LSTADAAVATVTQSAFGSTAAFGTAAANRAMLVAGLHVGNGGTLTFRWAQNTSNVNATTVRAGSQIRYRQVGP
jgi:hypothetical protein